MRKLAEIDAKLIDLTQDAYLWLYDRTGVYIATVMVAFILAGEAVSPKDTIGLVSTGFICLMTSPKYVLQMMGMKEAINATARVFRSSYWRYAYVIVMVGLAVAPSNNWLSRAFSAGFDLIALAYVGAVQLRDREPKDLLPRLTAVGANA